MNVAEEGGKKNEEREEEEEGNRVNAGLPEQATDKPARSDEGAGQGLHSVENPGRLHAEGKGGEAGGRVKNGLAVGEVKGAVMSHDKTRCQARVNLRPDRVEENRSTAAAGKHPAAQRHLLDTEISLGGTSGFAENRATRGELGVPSVGEKGGKKIKLFEDEENGSDTALPEQAAGYPAISREGAGEDLHSVEETGGLRSITEQKGIDERGELAALRRQVIALQATALEETTKRLQAEETALGLRDLLKTTVESYEAQLAHFMARCPRIAKDGDNHPGGAMEETLPLTDESSWSKNTAEVDLLSGYDYTTAAETVSVTPFTSTSDSGEGEREERGKLPGHPVQVGNGSTSTVVVRFEGQEEEIAATNIFEEEERGKAGEEQDKVVGHTSVSEKEEEKEEEEEEEEEEEKVVVASGDGVGAEGVVLNSVLPPGSNGGISEDSGPRSTGASSGPSGNGVEVFRSSPTTASHDHEVLGNEMRMVEGAAQQDIAKERESVLGNRSGPLQDVPFLAGNVHTETSDGETQVMKKNTAEIYGLGGCGSRKRSARPRNPLLAWRNAERSVSIHREIGDGETQATKKRTAEKEGYELEGCGSHKSSSRPKNPLLAWSNTERSIEGCGPHKRSARRNPLLAWSNAECSVKGRDSHKRSVRPRNPLLAWSNVERSVSGLAGRPDALQGSPGPAPFSFVFTARRTKGRDTTDSSKGSGDDVSQSTPPVATGGEGGDLGQEEGGVGADTPRALAIGSSELQRENGTEEGGHLRARRVVKFGSLALDNLSEAIVGGDFDRDFSNTQRRAAELEQGGVSFLADIAKAEDAGLIQMGEVIGQGGYGVVCGLTIVDRRKRAAALQYTAGRELVLKAPLQGSHIDFDDSYLKEIRILQRFGAKAHPNLLSAVSVSEKNRHIVTIRMAGDLNDLLEHPKLMRRMPKATLMRNLAGVGDALGFLHDNDIIHADVKPANILRDKNFSRFVLTDLGEAGESGKTPAGGGTPWWVPPETIGDYHGNGPSPIDLKMLPSSDVYSLAIVAHQLLTGSLLPVTSGATIFKHRDSIPDSPSKTMIMDFRRTNRAKLQAADDDSRQEAQRIILGIYSGHVAQECRMDDLEKTLLSPAMFPQRREMQFSNQARKVLDVLKAALNKDPGQRLSMPRFCQVLLDQDLWSTQRARAPVMSGLAASVEERIRGVLDGNERRSGASSSTGGEGGDGAGSGGGASGEEETAWYNDTEGVAPWWKDTEPVRQELLFLRGLLP
ncbi:unnamed protein product [Ectocarpus fasciculatus]